MTSERGQVSGDHQTIQVKKPSPGLRHLHEQERGCRRLGVVSVVNDVADDARVRQRVDVARGEDHLEGHVFAGLKDVAWNKKLISNLFWFIVVIKTHTIRLGRASAKAFEWLPNDQEIMVQCQVRKTNFHAKMFS